MAASKTGSGSQCYEILAPFKAGLSGVEKSLVAAPLPYLRSLSVEYNALMTAARASQDCYRAMLEKARPAVQARRGKMNSPRILKLRRGIRDSGRIFSQGHAQFRQALEKYSPAILAAIEPAAGGVAGASDAEGGASVVQAAQELLKNSEAIATRQSALAGIATSSH